MGIPEQERFFYLKRYVAGEALQAIDSSTVEVALHMKTQEKSSKTGMVTHLLYRKRFVRD